MNKKSLSQITVVFMLVCIMVVPALAKEQDVSLLVIPRDDTCIRLALDIANNYPVMVLAYNTAGGATVLHGWDGTKWVGVTLEAYAQGAFFTSVGPDKVLLVEAVGAPLPENLVPPSSWCPSSAKIVTTVPRTLLLLLGRYYDFPYSHWKWFAKRYGYQLEEINPQGLNIRWYHRRLDENLARRQALYSNDMQYWTPLTEAVAPVVEVPMLEEIPEPKLEPKPKPEPEPEPLPEPETLSADVPPAVVLGPGEADEEDKISAEIE
ncbi:MAG: hypothetical protein K9M45_08905 [Kiritimatiellales bacterium]|nr:hypothetical protein [Kiritimatiellales bacterium]